MASTHLILKNPTSRKLTIRYSIGGRGGTINILPGEYYDMYTVDSGFIFDSSLSIPQIVALFFTNNTYYWVKDLNPNPNHNYDINNYLFGDFVGLPSGLPIIPLGIYSSIYGRLYNLFVMNDPRGLATGNVNGHYWRKYVEDDIIDLLAEIGGTSFGGSLKEIGTDHWDTPNSSATDLFNFKALGSGVRLINGNFSAILRVTLFWIDNAISGKNTLKLGYNYGDVIYNNDDPGLLRHGLSIRLTRDLTDVELLLSNGTYLQDYTDLEGQTYKVVKIGSRAWMAENLKTTYYADGTAITNLITNLDWSTTNQGGYCNYNNDI